MWNYYSFYPYAKKVTFSLGGRLNEVFIGANVNAHYNNYSTHKGFGGGGETKDSYQDKGIQIGEALKSLPRASHNNSPYKEAVWSPPGFPPGVTRVIFAVDDENKMYFTDDHYNIYWKIYGNEAKHTKFA